MLKCDKTHYLRLAFETSQEKENQVPTIQTIKSISPLIDMPFQYNCKILRLHGCFVCPTAKSLSDQIHLILHRVNEERS